MKAPTTPTSRELAAQHRYPTLVDPNADWVLGSTRSDKDLDEAGPGRAISSFLADRHNLAADPGGADRNQRGRLR